MVKQMLKLLDRLYSAQYKCFVSLDLCRGHGTEVIQLFSCSTQLNMKLIMLINVKNANNNILELGTKKSLYFSEF